jgi:hypothetical protein
VLILADPPRRKLMQSRFLTTATLALVVLLLTLFPQRADAHAVSHLETFSVLTYNVAGMDMPAQVGPVTLHENVYSDVDIIERAHMIADKILAGDYDIVTLQEVWANPWPSDSMRETLIDDLSATYPYHTEELGGGSPADILDSGLIVFSKHEFVPVNRPSGQHCAYPSEDIVGKCTVAFHEFDASAGEDAYAAKGVGFVRVKNPANDSQTNVFFTHLQADPKYCIGECDVKAMRAEQVKQIVDFVNAWAPQGDPTRDTLLLGDLNVRFVDENGQQTAEYKQLVGADSLLAGTGLTDAVKEHSPTDPFATYDAALTKYDYILHRSPPLSSKFPLGYCMQHQWVPNSYVTTGSGDNYHGLYLSDHRPYAALIGRSATALGVACNPATALALPWPGTGSHPGFVSHPGAYQWFHFAPGTWEFRVFSPAQLELKAYRDDDLSHPIKAFDGDGVIKANDRAESLLISPEKPFFLRVRADDPAKPFFVGGYTLIVLLHDGHSPQTAIQIDPFQTKSSKLMVANPSQPAQQPQGRVWYLLRTHTLWSQAQQRLRFTVKSPTGKWLRLKLYARKTVDTQLPTIPSPLAQSLFTSGKSELPLPNPNDPQQVSPVPGIGADYYLTVEKEANEPGALFLVEWETNLFFVDAGILHIDGETDFSPEDEPEPVVTIDSQSVDVPLGSVSKDQDQGFVPWLRPVLVGQTLGIHMYEEDGDVGECFTAPAKKCDDLGNFELGPSVNIPLNPGGDPTVQFHKYGSDPEDDLYTLHYQTWRRVDDGGAPDCGGPPTEEGCA